MRFLSGKQKALALLLGVGLVFGSAPAPVFAEGTSDAQEYTLTINNEVGGTPEIYVDSDKVSDQSKIAEGKHSIYVYGDYETDELMGDYVTLKVNGKVIGEPTEIDYVDGACFQDVLVDGDVSIRIASDDKVLCNVTVTNGAAAVNTEYAVNALHVYRTDIDDDSDIEGTTEMLEGAKISVYPYPVASDVWLTIRHNGEIVYDQLVEQIVPYVDDDNLPFIDLELKGDLEVTTRGKCTVTIDDQVKSDDVIFTVGTVDMSGDTPKPVTFSDGDKILQGEYLAARVVNTSSDKLQLTAEKDDGTVIDTVTIDAATDEEGEANGIMIEAVDSNVKFVLKKVAAASDSTKQPETQTTDKSTEQAKTEKDSVTLPEAGNTSTGKETTENKPVVKATSLRNVKGAKKKFTAKWKKVSGVTGYKIQYSKNKKFKSGKKTVTVKGQKKVKKVVKKLKKGTYYVRICAYKKVGNKIYKSKWSKAKSVKVK